jgi:hypothetical protein
MKGKVGFERKIAMRGMIGVAYATGLGLYEDLASPRRGNFTLPKDQGLSELLDKSGMRRLHRQILAARNLADGFRNFRLLDGSGGLSGVFQLLTYFDQLVAGF